MARKRESIGIRWHRYADVAEPLLALIAAVAVLSGAVYAVATGTFVDWLSAERSFDENWGVWVAAATLIAVAAAPLAVTATWTYRRVQARRWSQLARDSRRG